MAQGKSMCYGLPVINAISGKPPREPQGGGEHTVRVGAGTARCDRKSSIGPGMKYRTLRFLGAAAVSFIISPCVSLAQIAGAAQVAAGERVYSDYCSNCH